MASAIVATVMMATLIVGPFYLSAALGLGVGATGLAMSVGPIVAALVAAPAGRLVDRLGSARTSLAGLAGAVIACSLLAVAPRSFGIAGYLGPIALLTASYALFQAANNTAVVANAPVADRGVVSGLLSLSRNLGLVTGASEMGALFALASGATDLRLASPEAVDTGMRATFLAAAALVSVAAILVMRGSRSVQRASGSP